MQHGPPSIFMSQTNILDNSLILNCTPKVRHKTFGVQFTESLGDPDSSQH